VGAGVSGDYGVSLIRTIVPIVVGSIVAELARRGVDIDGAAVGQAVTAICIAAYYAAARALERRWPAAGWLLGQAKPPTYGSTERP
jgi:uncharacterized membrane protein (DUF441 family)